MPRFHETPAETDRNQTLQVIAAGKVRELAPMYPDAPFLPTLVEEFYSCFPQDTLLARLFFSALSEPGVLHTNEMLILVHQVLGDAVAHGFPKISLAFSEDRQAMVRRGTGRGIFHLCNLLALGIYLAELNLQVHKLKTDFLAKQKQLLGQDSEEFARLQKHVLGALLPQKDGIIRNDGQLEERKNIDQHRVKFASDRVWLPDKEKAQAMVDIGKLFGRQDHSDRSGTYKVIGRLSVNDLLLLFPDLRNNEIQVPEQQRSLVEMAFRDSHPDSHNLTYEQVRDLFRQQFGLEG